MKEQSEGPAKVTPGVEVFLQDEVHLVQGKRVGLVTNPTGIDSRLESTIDLFARHPNIGLAALFGPEHGVTGTAQAGEYVPEAFDSDYGFPIYSLYGQSEHAELEEPDDLDINMRLFDTQDRGKHLEHEMLENIDVLIFDLQDVGTRIFTYIATMIHCMKGCIATGIEFIVLDRPNPINGRAMEGPLLQYPEFSSFVGVYPIPVRYGLTLGELASYFNSEYLDSEVRLNVIPMRGWGREMWFEDTGLPWIAPSPNMPTLDTVKVYPGQVYFEGTNVSEGRGTTLPFELFGAPWINGRDLARKLNRFSMPGVTFREAAFQPVFSKFSGQACQGCQIHVQEKDEFRPLETSLFILQTIHEDYPDAFCFHSKYFDTIMGTNRVRTALLDKKPVGFIAQGFASDIKKFEGVRKPHLLY